MSKSKYTYLEKWTVSFPKQGTEPTVLNRECFYRLRTFIETLTEEMKSVWEKDEFEYVEENYKLFTTPQLGL